MHESFDALMNVSYLLTSLSNFDQSVVFTTKRQAQTNIALRNCDAHRSYSCGDDWRSMF